MKKTDNQFYVILDNIRSIENVGSIFRTADALAVTKIYLGGISGINFYRSGVKVKTLNPKISKTALGAELNVPWEHCWQVGRIIAKLKKQNVKIVALEQTKEAINILKFKPNFPLALVLGNEVKGISKATLNRCQKVIQIPMRGKKESLNVAAAFGIAGFEINRFRFL